MHNQAPVLENNTHILRWDFDVEIWGDLVSLKLQ